MINISSTYYYLIETYSMKCKKCYFVLKLVRIKLISSLKRIAGFEIKDFEIHRPTPLKEIIKFEIPDEHIFVVINETEGGTMESIIKNDDYVLLSPVFGGG